MEENVNNACLNAEVDFDESSWVLLDPDDIQMDPQQITGSSFSPLNVLAHFQANSSNFMTGKEIVHAFNYADSMFEHSRKLSHLVEAIDIGSPTDLKKFAEEAVDVCSNCSDKIQCFTESIKTISDKLSAGVKLINNELGEAMQNRCTQYLDNISRAKEVTSLKEHLKQCLTQENLNQTKILEQIQQQNQQIQQSVQSAYEITSYFNFLTAVFNFGMAANALIQTCQIVEKHKEMMKEEKEKLTNLNVSLEDNREKIKELIENFNSINTEKFDIKDSMYLRLYEISSSIMEIRLELERIKGKLNQAIGETQSQKLQHMTGVCANGIGVVLSTVAAAGQLNNVWNAAAVGLNLLGSTISYIGIRKCNSDLDDLQIIAKHTEELIQNANNSLKLIQSKRKQSL